MDEDNMHDAGQDEAAIWPLENLATRLIHAIRKQPVLRQALSGDFSSSGVHTDSLPPMVA